MGSTEDDLEVVRSRLVAGHGERRGAPAVLNEHRRMERNRARVVARSPDLIPDCRAWTATRKPLCPLPERVTKGCRFLDGFLEGPPEPSRALSELELPPGIDLFPVHGRDRPGQPLMQGIPGIECSADHPHEL